MNPTELNSVRHRLLPVIGILTVASVLSVAPLHAQEGTPAGSGSGLEVTLERLGSFFYAGDPVQVRISVYNSGTASFENPSGLDPIGHTQVVDLAKGRLLAPRPGRKPDMAAEPRVLPPGGFFGFVTDLGEAVDGLAIPGKYQARISLPGAETAQLDLTIIERYDPGLAYRAVMDTDYGTLSFDLLGSQAPRHVQNFYDLANQGFYDGSVVHIIVKGVEIHAGDRTGDGRSNPGYFLEPEIDADLKHLRGTLSMLRTGPMDHGSQFVISLAENRRVDGVLTIFGRMAKGADVLSALEAIPTSGTREKIPYKPLTQVGIRTVRVEKAPDGSAATGSGASR